jgi:hypothetical protein
MSHPSWPPNSIEHRSIEVAIRIPPRKWAHGFASWLQSVKLRASQAGFGKTQPDLAKKF